MTENKRFTIIETQIGRVIRDNKTDINTGDIGIIFDWLNELAEENEQLKQSYKEFEDECQSTFNAMNRKQNDLYRKNFKLKEENEQLKFDKQQLHRAMSREEVRHKQFQDKVFDLIDEKIKEADEGLKQTYDSWYQGKIDVLAELKKELSE